MFTPKHYDDLEVDVLKFKQQWIRIRDRLKVDKEFDPNWVRTLDTAIGAATIQVRDKVREARWLATYAGGNET